jgi:hypothetical protein
MANNPEQKRSLDERLAAFPEVREQMMRMADELEQAGDRPDTLDEVEDRIVDRIRRLGREILGGCAQQMAAQAPVPLGRKVRRHSKKKSAG